MKLPMQLPQTLFGAVMGIGGEICFGLAIGMILSLVFIAVQWAGEVIGQQMGLNISEVLDPQFGGAGSLIGDLYFWFAMMTFLSIRGDQMLLRGVKASFEALPVLSVGINESIIDLLLSLLTGATTLALCLAGPMLITMIVVDLALGCISKTMPQFNVMSAGLTIRAVVGVVVLLIGMSLTGNVMKDALGKAMETVHVSYRGQ
jgi:flagellar biosynthesis protein FliR